MSVLPPYSVRVSARAQRLQLKVLPPGRVEVVVPRRIGLDHVPAFVAEHRHWLQRQLARMTALYCDAPLLPQAIHLPALDERWQVSYGQDLRHRWRQPAAGCLHITAPDERHSCLALQQWLQQRARQVLPPWLAQVSEELGLPFRRVTVRAQKSRWGSCSARRNINLNRALLFVSPGTVRYLMVHELCHTVHLNHSPRYWRLVESMLPGYRDHEAELRQAQRVIPRWALPVFGD